MPRSAPATIRVHGAAVYSHHGVSDAERALGGRFEFDLELYTDIAEAAAGDNLHATVDYAEAYRLVHDLLGSAHRRLLETLVVEIADGLLAHFSRLESVTVRLRKHSVPIAGIIDAVEVELFREREE